MQTNGSLAEPEDCPIESWKVCDDKLCEKQSKEQWFEIKNSTLNIDISVGIPYIEKYLGVFTTGKVNSTYPMIISICGKEEVSVLNEGSPEVY